MSNLYNFTPDMSAPDASGLDQSRQAPTGDKYISIKEALEIFTSKGRAVTERTLQRYCEKHQLDGQKLITGEGEKWFVTRSSVHRRIEELNKFDALRASRQAATSPDLSRPDAQATPQHFETDQARPASTPSVSSPVESAQTSHPTSPDEPRHDATSRALSQAGETPQPQKASALSPTERELYEQMLSILKDQRDDLMRDKENLQSDKVALLAQLTAKDRQIDRFFESERDTKTLAGRLQSLMSALWPKKEGQGGERYVPIHEGLESGLPQEREQEHS